VKRTIPGTGLKPGKLKEKKLALTLKSTWPCSAPGEEHDGHSGCDHGGDVE
jgi:hypothetical protein